MPDLWPSGDRTRRVSRVVLSTVVALGACVSVWLCRSDQLSPPDDIVGYPTWANFDYQPLFLGYRLATWGLLVVAASTYLVLRRWGPLRDPRSVSVAGHEAEVSRSPDAGLSPHRSSPSLVEGVVPGTARLLPTAGLVALAASLPTPADSSRITGLGLLLALGYVVGVRGFASVGGRRGVDEVVLVSTVNAVAGVVASTVALALFARTTQVDVVGRGTDTYQWMPWWVVVGGVVVGGASALASLVRTRDTVSVERRVITVVVGSTIVFLLVAQLPGVVESVVGLDDSLSDAGADLSSRGYAMWRDLLTIHGPFEDVLRSSVGYALFGRTFWATVAVADMVWTPICWVGVYLLGLRVARGSVPRAVVLVVVVVSAAAALPFTNRWLGLTFVLLLLAAAVEHRRTRWTAALTTALFACTVLVPESVFLLAAVGVTLVLSDVANGGGTTPVLRRLTTTRDFVGTGLVLTASWAVLLATHHALSGFVTYFAVYGPGHAAAGTLPVTFGLAGARPVAIFVLFVAIAMSTLTASAWRIAHGTRLTTTGWVAVAAALVGALYGEKAVARLDSVHLGHSITVLLPVVVIVVASGLTRLDDVVEHDLAHHLEQHPGRRATLPVRHLVSGVLATLLVCSPPVLRAGWNAPGHNRVVETARVIDRLGYTRPGAIDTTLFDDLDRVLASQGGDSEVFDFTNSPGIIYGLLGARPATRFFHISDALPGFAQDMVIADLRRSRPAVVVWDARYVTGLSIWDGVTNQVRHYSVSQFVLDGWTPVVSTHHVLFLLRNDLVGTRSSTPGLQTSQSTGLYQATGVCDWGLAAHYLASRPAGVATALSIEPSTQMREVRFHGWAFDGEDGGAQPVRRVLVVAGGVVVDTVRPGLPRPGVATLLGAPEAALSGFRGWVLTPRAGPVRFYVELADRSVRPLGSRHAAAGPSPGTVSWHGRQVPVLDRPLGNVAPVSVRRGDVSEVTVPAGTELASQQLATFSAGGAEIGRSRIALHNSLSGSGSDKISMRTLARDSELDVRVGSCLSWHDYSGSRLYLVQTGGRPLTSITLHPRVAG